MNMRSGRAPPLPNEERTPPLLWMAAFVIVFGASFSFGYNLSVLNPLLLNMGKGSLIQDLGMEKTHQELATSMLNVGAALGSLAGWLPEALGFKFTLRWFVPGFQFVGTALSMGGTLWLLCAGRFLCGVGTGLAAIVAPVLLAEIAAPMQRGLVVSFHQIGITVGIFFASLAGFSMSGGVVESAWRYSFAIGTIPSIVLMVLGGTFVPDSPRWSIRRGLRKEAEQEAAAEASSHRDSVISSESGRKPLMEEPLSDTDAEVLGVPSPTEMGGEFRRGRKEAKLFLLNFRPLSYDYRRELALMVDEVREERELHANRTGLARLGVLLEPRYRFHVLFGVILMLPFVLSGTAAIVFYSTSIFDYANIERPIEASLLVFACNIVFTTIGTFLVDRVGRRRLLLIGFTVMGVALTTLAVLMAFFKGNPWALSVFCVLLFISGYAIGPALATWVVLGEVLPTRIRASAFSVCMVVYWLLIITLSQVTLTGVHEAGNIAGGNGAGESSRHQLFLGLASMFWFFDIMCGFGIVFTFFFVPNTSGVPLEQIQDDLLKSGLLGGCLARSCGAKGRDHDGNVIEADTDDDTDME